MKHLKEGITTGACAALCAYGAVKAALGEAQDKAVVYNPHGLPIEGDITAAYLPDGKGVCRTVKHSGDDPDVTDGVTVTVTAELIPGDKVEIRGGRGIGRVTKKGLDRPPGDWAINSGPRKMIEAAVQKAAAECERSTGACITVEIPGGEEIAKRTFNPRLGIEGGLSVLGTDGILRPMSTAALVDTIRAELSVKRSQGLENITLCPGRTGEEAAMLLGIPPENIAQCSNFIGEALDAAAEQGFSSALLVGHIGKTVKLGSGVFNTHSRTADARMETLAACGVFAGVDPAVLRGLDGFVSADAAVKYLCEAGVWEKVAAELGRRSDRYLAARAGIPCGVAWFGGKNTLLGMSEGAKTILEREK